MCHGRGDFGFLARIAHGEDLNSPVGSHHVRLAFGKQAGRYMRQCGFWIGAGRLLNPLEKCLQIVRARVVGIGRQHIDQTALEGCELSAI